MVFELQAKACHNVLDTDDDNADWQDFSKSQTNSPHRYRLKFVRPRIRMVLRTGIGLAVSVRAWENPTWPLIQCGQIRFQLWGRM